MLDIYLKLAWTEERSKACIECLKDLKYHVSQFNERFKGTNQEDAHEFLSTMLESLSKSLPINHSVDQENNFNAKIEENSDVLSSILKEEKEWWKEEMKNENSVITDYFRGQTVRTIMWLKWRKSEYAFQSFTSFNLEIPINSESVTLQDCLKETTKRKVYGEDSGYECDIWGLTSYSEIEKFCRLPKLIIIQLNRFKELDNQRMKILTSVELDSADLDMATYIHDDFLNGDICTKYSLYGISYHYGGLEGGHYTADIKNFEQGKWYSWDDDKINEIDAPVLSGASPYILFFCRNDL